VSSKNNVAKKKAREERIRKAKHEESRRKCYPSIVIINGDQVSSYFLNAITKAVDTINFDSISSFHKDKDPREYLRKITRAESSDVYFQEGGSQYLTSLHLYIWAALIQSIGIDKVKALMPEEGFRVAFCKNTIFVICKKIHANNSIHNRFYTNDNYVQVGKKNYKLHYSKHMVERLFERGNYITENQAGEWAEAFRTAWVFSLFYDIVDINLYKISASFNQIFVDFYVLASGIEFNLVEHTNTIVESWSENILVNSDGLLVAKRIVAPMAIFDAEGDGKFDDIVLKTSLLPGFEGTLEYSIMNRITFPRYVKKACLDVLDDPQRRYTKEYTEIQHMFNKRCAPQYYWLQNNKTKSIALRNLTDKADSIPEIKHNQF
jgi:hypothetical protein